MKNINKRDYVIIAMIIFLFFWYDNYSYKTAILIILWFLIFVIIEFTRINKKLKNEKYDIIQLVYFVMGFILYIVSNNIANHFISKNEVYTCGIVSQINRPILKEFTFSLKDNSSNFRLKGNLTVGDKVCITYNPNEKWYGYAYVFKLEKQPF